MQRFEWNAKIKGNQRILVISTCSLVPDSCHRRCSKSHFIMWSIVIADRSPDHSVSITGHTHSANGVRARFGGIQKKRIFMVFNVIYLNWVTPDPFTPKTVNRLIDTWYLGNEARFCYSDVPNFVWIIQNLCILNHKPPFLSILKQYTPIL